jgi:hypothetical protein
MKLTEPQKDILNNPARFKVVASGRRFGKTYASIAALAKHSRYPNSKCMYIAPSYRMAKQIVWEDLKLMLKQRRWAKRINESELTITLVNNSQIMLRSADNPDSIRGVGLDFVVIDEAADIDNSGEAWGAVIRPTLSDREGHALIIGSPKGRNWFYDLYQNAKHYEDWHSWQYTTAEGGNVSEAEINQARQDLDERTFQQEYLAQFVNYSGVIYYAFGEHNIKSMPQPADLRTPLHIGMDFNIDPGCAVIGYQHREGIHIFDELEIYGTDTGEMSREIQQRYPNRKIIVYPDAAGAQRKTSAGGVTDHIILKNSGFELKVGSINPSVKDRIAAVNSVCKSNDGVVKLSVEPSCKKTIECLRKQVYKEGTRQPEKSGYDHMNDALGYLINHLYPLRQNVKPAPVGGIRRQTGGHYR